MTAGRPLMPIIENAGSLRGRVRDHASSRLSACAGPVFAPATRCWARTPQRAPAHPGTVRLRDAEPDRRFGRVFGEYPGIDEDPGPVLDRERWPVYGIEGEPEITARRTISAPPNLLPEPQPRREIRYTAPPVADRERGAGAPARTGQDIPAVTVRRDLAIPFETLRHGNGRCTTLADRDRAALHRLAGPCIFTRYDSSRHGVVEASDELLMAVITSMATLSRCIRSGFGARAPEADRAGQRVEPITVAWIGSRPHARLRLTDDAGSGRVTWTIRTEDGRTIEGKRGHRRSATAERRTSPAPRPLP